MLRTFPVFLAFLVVAGAHAQVITRDKKADPKADAKSGDKAGDDDDILAPKSDGKKPVDATPTEAKPKSYAVGLVAIVPVGDAGKSMADKATVGLQKELGAGHVFDVTPLAVDIKQAGGAGPGVDEAAAKAALADGKSAFDKAQQALDKVKMGVAKKGFEQALASYEKAAPVLTDAQPLIDCHVALAEVAARSGEDAEQDAQLTAAAALNPEKELDKKRYPGAFVTAYLKAREKLLRETKKGSVVVDATGAGASVEIDGRPTAGAPVTVTEVPQGRHLVRAVREGLPSYGVVVDVKGGESVSVAPGFIAKDGKSYLDDLQNNRLTPDAAKAVADAAKAANMKGAVVGVVSKTSTGSEVQLVLVDAGGGMTKLPSLAFTGDMLDIGIETLKARDAIEAGFDKPAFTSTALASLIEGAAAGAGVRMATVALRYDVQPIKAPTRSRLLTDDKKPTDEDAVATTGPADDDDADHKVLAAGKSGTRKRLDDEEDPYAGKNNGKTVADPDAPLTEQGWFWPTVVGGGAGALVLIASGTVLGLVAAKVLPDPRPTSGAQVNVAVP